MRVEEPIPEAMAGERVDRVVAMLTGCSRAEAADLVAAGAVTVAGAAVTTRSARVRAGDVVAVEVPDRAAMAELRPEPEVHLTVVHEDDDLLVLDKPAGLVVHPGAGRATGTLVHGLLLVARTQRAYEALVAALSARAVHRRYRTLVWGHLAAASGLIDAPIGRSTREPTRMSVDVRGKEARTRYEVIRHASEPVEVTELACTLETGRTHQIRVHLRSIGHPVVGDARYDGNRQSLPLDRPFLHAEGLALDHPVTGVPLSFESPLPADLQAVLSTLR